MVITIGPAHNICFPRLFKEQGFLFPSRYVPLPAFLTSHHSPSLACFCFVTQKAFPGRVPMIKNTTQEVPFVQYNPLIKSPWIISPYSYLEASYPFYNSMDGAPSFLTYKELDNTTTIKTEVLKKRGWEWGGGNCTLPISDMLI